MQRRDFLVSAALVPGLGLVPGVAGAATDRPTMAAASVPLPASPALASTGALGTQLELLGGFRIVDAYEVFHGAIPFVVEGEGERFQLDALRRSEGGASGVHTSEHFTFFTHGGGGPAQERGARALGMALDRAVRNGTALPALASFEERSSVSNATLHVDFVRSTATPSV